VRSLLLFPVFFDLSALQARLMRAHRYNHVIEKFRNRFPPVPAEPCNAGKFNAFATALTKR